MRWMALLLTGCVVPLAGCNLFQASVHNLYNEPVTYFDERKVTRQIRDEAEDLLNELCGHRGRVFTHDFKHGFIDGYADQLEHGGAAVPPAIPPLKYRRGRFLNPDGHARIHDYFAGFQMGADTAAQSGKRQYLTVPVLVSDPVPERTANATQVPADQCAKPAAADEKKPPTPITESLPPPRAVDPATGLPVPDRQPVKPDPDAKPQLPVIPDGGKLPDTPKPDAPKPDVPKGSGSEVQVPPLPDVPPGRTEPTGLSLPNADDPTAVRERVVVPPLADAPRRPGAPD